MLFLRLTNLGNSVKSVHGNFSYFLIDADVLDSISHFIPFFKKEINRKKR
jgi:hypothetical protein